MNAVGISLDNAAGQGGSSAEVELAKLPRRTDYVPITVSERLARIEKAQRLMVEQGIDALYLDTSTSLYYFTGLRLWASERLHGTPSEMAITQASVRVVDSSNHQPPASLSEEFIRDHTGDFHGPASQHARDFPDGRVGSHSELANIEHGEALIAVAASALIGEFTSWMTESD